MSVMSVCCAKNCSNPSDRKSRLSPEGFLNYIPERGYEMYAYCEPCHQDILGLVWQRVTSTRRSDDNPAPTAI